MEEVSISSQKLQSDYTTDVCTGEKSHSDQVQTALLYSSLFYGNAF